MKKLAVFLLLILAQLHLAAQEPATMLGTISLKNGQTATGRVSYNFYYVFVYSEASFKPTSYPAADVIEFTLHQGGGTFVSIPSGKKGKYNFYEIESPRSPLCMLVSNAKSIENRGVDKDEHGIKVKTDYFLFAPGEDLLIDANMKDIPEFLKTRCEGIATAITEYKAKAYHYGPLATKDEIKRKLIKIVDDYTNNRCVFVPRDY